MLNTNKIKKAIVLAAMFVVTLVNTRINVFAAGEDTVPYYDETEDTAGFLDPVITIALIVYIIGLILFLYGRLWEKKLRRN